MSAWNLIGVVAWLIVAAWLVFTVMNIRSRHLRMLVVAKREHSAKTALIDCAEIVVLILLAVGMSWVTWFRQPDRIDGNSVHVRYTYDKLLLQTDASRSYYVSVTRGNGTQPVQYYTYWTNGAKYQITSRNADVAAGTDPLTVRASNLPWQEKQLAKWDKQSERAYVATYIATYEPTFLNGLGMRVGRTATRFSIIRIPNETFEKITAAK
ncbi:LVIS_2131 family protein [Lacticaseibacillus nasuensis]|uniref:Uncharacterized protein n=1 Tax=Lacticaseibacillus nasuensis JCM 17158 TaxID=1291734 RepID=A0A0R1JRP7_9LACO|nr:LVIS_2131 family protein [Lacticaseibacillus nasuensis]KRK74016.1 hypothetical protein FD02_GL001851 [Lacticaseibacillus nasuensis JCM 17158]